MPDTSFQRLRLDHAGPVCRVTLDRPEVHNAFDDVTITELTRCVRDLGQRDDVRVIVVTGEGRSFCAGADLNWMKRMAGYERQENLDDARRLAGMLATIDTCPKAIVARVNGAAFGGACGLIACTDVAIAAERATFALSEVKLGLVPATISPFVHAKIGTSAARRYFLTGERFKAPEALRLGLVHGLAADDDLDDAVQAIVDQLLSSGPEAVREAKRLVREISVRRQPEVNEFTARLIADVRSTDEAREGMSAFLEKRRPAWSPDEN